MADLDVVVVLVTGPDEKTMSALAGELVGDRLAACVNLIPHVRSVYRWEDEVRRDAETLAVIKTTRGALRELEAAVRDLHPYDVPEFLVLPVEEGSAAYVGWLRDAVIHEPGDQGDDEQE